MATTTAPGTRAPRRTAPLRATRIEEPRIDPETTDEPNERPAPGRGHPPVAHLTDRIDALLAEDLPAEPPARGPGRLRSAAIVTASSVSVGSLMYWLVLFFR